MTPQEKEIQKMQDDIVEELRDIFLENMKIFNLDIPENDDRKAAELILNVMQKALDQLKEEVKAGKYDNF